MLDESKSESDSLPDLDGDLPDREKDDLLPLETLPVDEAKENDNLISRRNTDHHMEKGFRNPWSSFLLRTTIDFMKTMFSWDKVLPVAPEDLPLNQPNWEDIRNTPHPIQFTWLGHASCLVQFDGFNILTDPVFSQRCSPVSWAGPKRLVNAPENVIENLPEIDVVVISHDHYDHLDSKTVSQLKDKVNHWCVPLRVGQYVSSFGVPEEKIHEMDWWEEKKFGELTVACTPNQHRSGRSPWSQQTTLWSSWTLIGPSRRFYFGGDTGYRTVPPDISQDDDLHNFEDDEFPICPAFKEIGEMYGPFDISAIPIGAYNPRWIMSPQHVNPEEAVELHKDVRSKLSIAIHWGTFVLTCEPTLEPPKRLKRALERNNLNENEFILLEHGQTFNVDDVD